VNQLGNLEKLGILVIVILVVVVGVVAITPKENVDTALFPDEPKVDAASVEPLDAVKDPLAPLPADQVSPAGDKLAGDPNAWPMPLGAKTSDIPAPGGDKTVTAKTPGDVNGVVVPAPAPVEPAATEYTVAKGDTGASIAKKLLGKATAWSKIVEVNPGLDARKLKIGQKIKVPAAATALTAPTPSPAIQTPSVPGPQGPTTDPFAKAPVEPRTADPLPAPAPAAETKTYTVQPGDTLSDIARRELGSASRWREIVAANPQLRNSEVVRTGMKLTIPAKSAAVAKSSAAVDVVKPAPVAGGKTYTVQKGDSLSSIASRMLGSSGRWREIVAANEPLLHGSDRIAPGMELTIPSGTNAR